MVKPKLLNKFSLAELIKSNQSSTIINLLINKNGFANFENLNSY